MASSVSSCDTFGCQRTCKIMKTKLKLTIGLAAVLMLAGITTMEITGCKTTPVNVAVQSEGVIITSVDTGMMIWSDYVRAGKATQSQVDTVKDCYQHYYDAQMLSKAALEMYIAKATTNTTDIVTANAAVSVAMQTLLNNINQYLMK
jgi:hypothetical protein